MALPKISVEIDANTRDAQAGIAGLTKSIGQLQTAAGQGVPAAMNKAAGAVKLSNQQLMNMQFQINDMATMLASGQSPFVMIMQQGMQIGQLFGPGATVQQALKATGAGIMSFLTNPINLAIAGTAVLAGGASMLWDAFTGPAAKTAQERLQEIDDALTSLEGKYADVAEAARGMIEQAAGAGLLEATATLTKAQEEARKALADVRKEAVEQWRNAAAQMAESLTGATREVHPLKRELAEAARLFGIGATEASVYREQVARIRLDPNATAEVVEFADELAEAAKRAGELEARVKGTAAAAAILGQTSIGMDIGLAERMGITSLAEELQKQSDAIVGEANKIANRIAKDNRAAERLKERLESSLAGVLESLRSEEQVINVWYEKSLATLDEALSQRLIKESEYANARVGLEQETQARLDALRQQETSKTLGVYANFFGNMANLARAGGEKTLGVTKALSIAEALINSYKAYTQVLADPFFTGRPFLRGVAAASVLASGLAQVANIRSVNSSGGGRAGAGATAAPVAAAAPATSQNVAIQLTGGDMFDRKQVIGLINSINEAVEDGARIRVV